MAHMNCEAVAIGFGFCFGAVRGPRVKWGEEEVGGTGGFASQTLEGCMDTS